MVILLVVKRKVLGSLWDGFVVISVRKHICSAVSHIRVNFPGADASQHGDLFVSYVWCLGRRGSVAHGAVGTADEELWELWPPRNSFQLEAVAFGSCGTSTCG